MMNISKGYIRLFRQFLNWEWYDSPVTKILFIHLLLNANNKEGQWQGIKIKRGQFITSVEKLAVANGLTTQQTRTALNNLRMTKEIEIQTTNRYSIITINNYTLYQNDNIQTTNRKSDRNSVSENMPQTNNKWVTNSLTNKQQTENNLNIEFQQKNNKCITSKSTTNNNINSNTSYINISLSSKKITKEEREILNNYVERKHLAKSSVRAYVNALIKNGDYIEILEEEKKKQAIRKEKEEKAKLEKETQEKIDSGITPEEDKQIREIQQRIRRRRNGNSNSN